MSAESPGPPEPPSTPDNIKGRIDYVEGRIPKVIERGAKVEDVEAFKGALTDFSTVVEDFYDAGAEDPDILDVIGEILIEFVNDVDKIEKLRRVNDITDSAAALQTRVDALRSKVDAAAIPPPTIEPDAEHPPEGGEDGATGDGLDGELDGTEAEPEVEPVSGRISSSVSATVLDMINGDDTIRTRIASKYGLEGDLPKGRDYFIKLLFTTKLADVDADSAGIDITDVQVGDLVTIQPDGTIVVTRKDAPGPEGAGGEPIDVEAAIARHEGSEYVTTGGSGRGSSRGGERVRRGSEGRDVAPTTKEGLSVGTTVNLDRAFALGIIGYKAPEISFDKVTPNDWQSENPDDYEILDPDWEKVTIGGRIEFVKKTGNSAPAERVEEDVEDKDNALSQALDYSALGGKDPETLDRWGISNALSTDEMLVRKEGAPEGTKDPRYFEFNPVRGDKKYRLIGPENKEDKDNIYKYHIINKEDLVRTGETIEGLNEAEQKALKADMKEIVKQMSSYKPLNEKAPFTEGPSNILFKKKSGDMIALYPRDFKTAYELLGGNAAGFAKKISDQDLIQSLNTTWKEYISKRPKLSSKIGTVQGVELNLKEITSPTIRTKIDRLNKGDRERLIEKLDKHLKRHWGKKVEGSADSIFTVVEKVGFVTYIEFNEAGAIDKKESLRANVGDLTPEELLDLLDYIWDKGH